MKGQLLPALVAGSLLFSCAHRGGPKAVSQTEGRHHEREARQHARPGRNTMEDSGIAGAEGDTAALNERNRGSEEVTPSEQGNGEIDIDITQRIRKAVVADDSLSFTAKNVKIVTRDGHVTLRGSVHSGHEKEAIYKAASDQAGVGRVTNQLQVSEHQ